MNFILSSFKTKKTKITKQDTHTHTRGVMRTCEDPN